MSYGTTVGARVRAVCFFAGNGCFAVTWDSTPSTLACPPENSPPDETLEAPAEHATVWRKEGYHDDYTKSPFLPDDREDITEYVELLAMLHSPGVMFTYLLASWGEAGGVACLTGACRLPGDAAYHT